MVSAALFLKAGVFSLMCFLYLCQNSGGCGTWIFMWVLHSIPSISASVFYQYHAGFIKMNLLYYSLIIFFNETNYVSAKR